MKRVLFVFLLLCTTSVYAQMQEETLFYIFDFQKKAKLLPEKAIFSKDMFSVNEIIRTLDNSISVSKITHNFIMIRDNEKNKIMEDYCDDIVSFMVVRQDTISFFELSCFYELLKQLLYDDRIGNVEKTEALKEIIVEVDDYEDTFKGIITTPYQILYNEQAKYYLKDNK